MTSGLVNRRVLRILSLNYEFPPIGGGGGNAHQHILREFRNYPDIDLTLITTTPQPELYGSSYSPNVRIVFLPQKKKDLLYWRRSEIVEYLACHYGFLRTHLQKEAYDLCHVFFGFPSGFLAYLHRKRLPYIVSVRGSDVPGYNRRFSLDYVLLRPMLKRIYRSSQRVIANSRGLKELYEKQFPDLRAGVIPNGIDAATFTPRREKDWEEWRLVCAARLIARKGIDLLLQACQRLVEDGINFSCHLIGDGPEESSLKRMAGELRLGERICFHGRMSRDEIARFLPNCDLFVLPSYAEGMSNAALEAMACGLPVLLTDTGGSRELIEGNGEIVPVGDAEALASALMRMLAQPEIMRRLGVRSRERAETFSWNNVAAQYYDLYGQIARHAGIW
ncbi:MAG: glycosyltransferase [Candidatus Omnitrophota bacterium]